METRRPRMLGLGALLVGMVALMGVMSWQAYRADRAREQLGREIVGHTAMLAADAWSEAASVTLFRSLQLLYAPMVERLSDSEEPATPDAVLESLDFTGACECVEPEDVLFAYTVDLASGEVKTSEEQIPTTARRLDRRILSARVARFSGRFGVGLLRGADADGSTIVFVHLVDHRGVEPVAAYGIAARPVVLEYFLDNAFDHGPLVPVELLRAGRNDSTFVFSVMDSRGRALFRTGLPVADAAYSRDQQLDELLEGLTLRVEVLPQAEAAIVGVFRSRVPLLLTLLTFTIAVAGFGLYLIKRETELAALRDNFITGVSHELRTPLAQIRMFAETLRLGRMRSPADRRRSLEIIDNESRRLAHLVDNVLQFARSGRGAIHLRLAPAHLAEDVRDAIHAFAVLQRSPGVEIRPELQEGIVANVDRDAVRQVLLNLLDNATKYGPLEQRITVGMALFGTTVRIWVDDEGAGIPVEEREHVFDAFYRLSRDQNSAVGGSGIGLAIVRELARAHGGGCRIDDAPGGGARIIVEFPDARLAAASAAVVA